MIAPWRVAAPDPVDRSLRDVDVPVVGAAHMTPRTHPDDVAAVLRDALC